MSMIRFILGRELKEMSLDTLDAARNSRGAASHTQACGVYHEGERGLPNLLGLLE